MSKPLEGIRVVEVAMWAFVPSAGGILADWGAEVIKIEAPTGDPIRGLVSGWRRQDRRHHLHLGDLQPGQARHRARPERAEGAERSSTSSPPPPTSSSPACSRVRGPSSRSTTTPFVRPTRRSSTRSGRARAPAAPRPTRVATTRSASGRAGRSRRRSRPTGQPPIGMPAGAFGDSLSGMGLAGGIAAALAHKAKTGEGGLGRRLVARHRHVVDADGDRRCRGGGPRRAAEGQPHAGPEPAGEHLSDVRRTMDRAVHVAARRVLGRLLHGDRPQGPDRRRALRRRHGASRERRGVRRRARQDVCDEDVGRVEAALAHAARSMGRRQPGVRPSAWISRRSRTVSCRRSTTATAASCRSIANPVQFDREPPELVPAPEFGADTDEILLSLGWDWDKIIEAKASGAVF